MRNKTETLGTDGNSWAKTCSSAHDVTAEKTKGKTIGRRLISIDEASLYTGLSIHTLYTMVSQRRIPYIKLGRLTKFDMDMLDAWIKQNTVMPMPEKKA